MGYLERTTITLRERGFVGLIDRLAETETVDAPNGPICELIESQH